MKRRLLRGARSAITIAMIVYLVDGTYEIFRAYHGAPGKKTAAGREVGAARALLSMWSAFVARRKVTHVAFAFDHVIESFRNDLFAGYKTGDGLPESLTSQFELAELGARALGFVVWPMIDFEADDALATGAAKYAKRPEVEAVRLCTPDKDLAQCVRGARVVGYDRYKDQVLDEAGVHDKFGVAPRSIPDWLALVGDSADGIPGIPRWGARSASQVLARYQAIEAIPEHAARWEVAIRGAEALARSLNERREDAALYKTLATLREDAPIAESLEDLAWRGADRDALAALCDELETELPRVSRWAE